MGWFDGWFKKKSVDQKAEGVKKTSTGDNPVPKAEIPEPIVPPGEERVPVFQTVVRKRTISPHGSNATIFAVKDKKIRRLIVNRRIRRLKKWIVILALVGFAVSTPFSYILYSTYANLGEGRQTIGYGLIDHARGTALLEVIISTSLLLISVLRVIFPKNESLYYFAQISYLFAVCQYGFLIPLNIRNFQKNLSNLKQLMRVDGDIGRCVKVQVDSMVPSKRKTYQIVVDKHDCVLHKLSINLHHIRPVLQVACDGRDSWYAKAMMYTNASMSHSFSDGTDHKFPTNPEDTSYEVDSQLWTATQRKHQCCGIERAMDWTKEPKEIEDFKKKNKIKSNINIDFSLFVYPRSCCPKDVPICFANSTHGPNCYPFEELTVMAYSVGLLLTLVGCGIVNSVVFIILICLRRMVEKFRPDLLQL